VAGENEWRISALPLVIKGRAEIRIWTFRNPKMTTLTKKMKRPLHIVLLLIFCFIANSASQQKSTEDKLKLKLDTDLVVLDAQVVSKRTGINIDNLRNTDFRLFEDGVEQEITYFSKDKLPISIILLIDISGSVGSYNAGLRKKSAASLRHLKPTDEVALMFFDSRAYLSEDFTTDHQSVEDLLLGRRTKESILPARTPGDATGTQIGDSIYQAAEQFLKSANPNGRRVIIAVSDNLPEGSRPRFSEKEVVEQLYEIGVMVYGIKVDRPSLAAKVDRYNPVTRLPKLFKDLGGNLNTYADKTGGVVLDGRDHKAEEQLTKLIEILRNRYSFGYTPSNLQMDGRFRKIKLKVSPEIEKREGGVVVLTKQGYYARKRKAGAKPEVEKPSVPKQD
jgi:Ca-activated chloride channel family protein